MIRLKRSHVIFLLFLVILNISIPFSCGDKNFELKLRDYCTLHAGEKTEAVANFQKLEKHYIKWHEGLFGSRRYHERKLREYLRTLIGSELETYHSYVMISPEAIFDKKVKCKFLFGKWLHCNGEMDLESVKMIIGEDSIFLKKWWRSRIIVSISGKIKKYRIGRDPDGDAIYLFLDKVRLIYKGPNVTKEKE